MLVGSYVAAITWAELLRYPAVLSNVVVAVPLARSTPQPGVASRAESITIYANGILQPRLIAWYGNPERRYLYSGLFLEPLPWTPVLQDVREIVQAVVGETFNSVLLIGSRRRSVVHA